MPAANKTSPSGVLPAVSAWQLAPAFDESLARLTRALREHLGQLDPWLPFPQACMGFAFGKRHAPLPIGALERLWGWCDELRGACPVCDGPIFGYGAWVPRPEQANRGELEGVCLRCGGITNRRVISFQQLVVALSPCLSGTPFEITFFAGPGGTVPGSPHALYGALVALGAQDLPPIEWLDWWG